MERQLLEMSVENFGSLRRVTVPLGPLSPALADRLRPEELIICERRSDGSPVIPAVSTRQIEKVSGTNRRYRESNAPDVLAHAVPLGCIERPDGTNRSWQQFRADVVDCCHTHIGSRGKTR